VGGERTLGDRTHLIVVRQLRRRRRRSEAARIGDEDVVIVIGVLANVAEEVLNAVDLIVNLFFTVRGSFKPPA
jgi:predicted signal transduction protein with EAL and GGDEF domain